MRDANPDNDTTYTTARITSANGNFGIEGQEATTYSDPNGNLAFIIEAGNLTSVTHVQPTIQKLDGNQTSKKASLTHFFQLQNTSDFYNVVINGSHIYLEDDYVYSDGYKYKWDSNDLFFIRGQNVPQEVFEKVLSNGDALFVGYEVKAENNSTWNLTSDITETAKLEITNPAHTPVTYDGSSYIISGTAQAEYTVHLYLNGIFLGTTKVDDNGEWTYGSFSLLQNEANTFEAYQYAPGNYGQNGEGSENPTTPATAIINEGAFASTEITLNDIDNNGLTISDTLDFTFLNPTYGHEFKKELTGTITINDGFGRTAVVKVENIDKDTIKVVDFVSSEPNFAYNSSSLIILGTDGLVNQDHLALNVAASKPILKKE